jgi:prepilin-type N-terminal cleavage/methylation domain-containing protein
MTVAARHSRAPGPARPGERGFSLVELLTVVAILLLLTGLVGTALLVARQRAQDAAAQADLRTALTTEKAFFADHGRFSDSVAAMRALQPPIRWGGEGYCGLPQCMDEVGQIRISSHDLDRVIEIGVRSASGTCFYLKGVASGAGAGTFHARSTACSSPYEHADLITSSSW